jgi:putative peptidoglycan lipid II flippase
MSPFAGRGVSRRVLFQMVIVGTCTGLVKIAGAAKVIFSARAFGVGDSVDAYFIAFLLAAFFGDTLAGSLNSALVPTFIEVREKEGRGAAQRLYQNAMAGAVLLLAVVACILFATAPWTMRPFASHFDDAKFALTCSLFRIMLPAMPIAAMASVWRSVLNSEGRFALPAMVPGATPAISIVFLLLYARTWGVYALAAGTLVGAGLEAALLAAMMLHRGFPILPRWSGRTAALSQVLAQYWPVVAGVVLLGGAPLIDQAIAAMLGSGSVSALQYGTRVTVVLLAVGPNAVATAILPHFSTLIVTRDSSELWHSLRNYAAIILAVTIPVIAVLVAISQPLVRVLFQHGQFDDSATAVVTSIQRYSLLQIPAAMVMALVVRLIASMKVNQLLFRAAILFGVLNLSLDLLLIRWMGISGIALSTAIVQLVTVIYLIWLMRKRLPASLKPGPSSEAVSR